MTTVLCSFLAMSRCVHTMSNVAALSSPVLISSMKVAYFMPNSMSPVVTRRRSPPDTPRFNALPITVSRHVCRPSCSTTTSG
ncbi:hypothetical protein PF010_g32441 [Phytophthora fragariae]|uniref:Secreted protein n=1 Tax=Phytophthora fragariae TaxID=53985 RepID=A0A6A3P8F8_9STRA|nr:hypothetical protein PF009_g32745 [Phytophthora fragariae]KAE9054659.1 hypothetical protein PF010_g32441 [Phytophthora fragariae]KAE9055297.1 hypothetical protein PF007_g32363 [Phytophthora fragariae]KAE9056063.1 hypothetical protein PF006_g32791 [Phytophthora fragariae]KAE9261602.1 hypothetical protein PF001_g32361 [Phytophthora fragariae]